LSRISNPSASINAPAVNPGSSNAHSPAADNDAAHAFRRENLTPSAHPALYELTRAQLGEAGRLAANGAASVTQRR
jgi:hypothetical protein